MALNPLKQGQLSTANNFPEFICSSWSEMIYLRKGKYLLCTGGFHIDEEEHFRHDLNEKRFWERTQDYAPGEQPHKHKDMKSLENVTDKISKHGGSITKFKRCNLIISFMDAEYIIRSPKIQLHKYPSPLQSNSLEIRSNGYLTVILSSK